MSNFQSIKGDACKALIFEKEIDGNRAVYELPKTKGKSGIYYEGKFTFIRLLSAKQKLGIGKLYRELLGERHEYATESEQYMAFAISQLEYRVVDSPDFFKKNGSDIVDMEILTSILEAALDAETSTQILKVV